MEVVYVRHCEYKQLGTFKSTDYERIKLSMYTITKMSERYQQFYTVHIKKKMGFDFQ